MTLVTLAVASHLEHNICSDVSRFLPLVSGSNGDSFSPFPRFIWIEDGSQDPIPETDQPPNLVRTYDPTNLRIPHQYGRVEAPKHRVG